MGPRHQMSKDSSGERGPMLKNFSFSATKITPTICMTLLQMPMSRPLQKLGDLPSLETRPKKWIAMPWQL